MAELIAGSPTYPALLIIRTSCPPLLIAIHLSFGEPVRETYVHYAAVSFFSKACIHIRILCFSPELLGIKYIPYIQSYRTLIIPDLLAYTYVHHAYGLGKYDAFYSFCSVEAAYFRTPCFSKFEL